MGKRSSPQGWPVRGGLYAAAYARWPMTVVIRANAWREKHDQRPRKSALMRGEAKVEANVVDVVEGARDT